MKAQILDLKRSPEESHTSASRKSLLRVEAKRLLHANWREIYDDIQILNEHEYHQRQSYEVLKIHNQHLEDESHHLRDLVDETQIIVQEIYDKATTWKT